METRFTRPSSICSFCGKAQHEIRKMVGGAQGIICDECVSTCLAVFLRQDAHFFDEVVTRARTLATEETNAANQNIRDQLIPMFYDRRIGLSTVVILCDTIAAHARFNMWFYDNVKCKPGTTEDAALAYLDRMDGLEVRCAHILREFQKGHDLKLLETALVDITGEMNAEMGRTTS